MKKFLLSIFRDKNFIILVFFLPLISACSFNLEKSKEVKDWEDEVLIAQNCGLIGLSCCLEREDTCETGSICCFDPNNSDIHECASECSCGNDGNFCCENNVCDDGLVCFGGRCAACGEESEYCCGNNSCEGELLCYQNHCVVCGNPNTPCCDDELKCKTEEEQESRLECIDNICKNCGNNSQIPCPTEPPCDFKFFESNNLCLNCGGFNQPCCVKTEASDYDCDTKKNLVCTYGFCTEKTN